MNETTAVQYPEHEKLKAISDKSQTIGEFLEWLSTEKGILLGEWGGATGHTMYPTQRSKVALLAEYFEIYQDRLESEKRAMLDTVRAAHMERES